MAVLAAAAVWLALSQRAELTAPAALLAACGVVCLAAAVALRRPVLIAPALAFVGGVYALRVASDAGPLDGDAALAAAALVVAGEVAAWSCELRVPLAQEPGAWWRRLAGILLAATGAYAVAAVVLAIADAGGGGLPLEALAVAALAAGAIGLVRLLP